METQLPSPGPTRQPPPTHCLHAAVPGLAAARSPGVSVSSASLWSAKNNSAKCNLKKAMFIIFPKLYMTNVGERERGGGQGRAGREREDRKPDRGNQDGRSCHPRERGRRRWGACPSGVFTAAVSPSTCESAHDGPGSCDVSHVFPVRRRQKTTHGGSSAGSSDATVSGRLPRRSRPLCSFRGCPCVYSRFCCEVYLLRIDLKMDSLY